MQATTEPTTNYPENIMLESRLRLKITNMISIAVNIVWMLSIFAIGAYAALTSISVFRWVSKSNIYDMLADIMQLGIGRLLVLGGINLLAFLWIIYNLRHLLHGIKQGNWSWQGNRWLLHRIVISTAACVAVQILYFYLKSKFPLIAPMAGIEDVNFLLDMILKAVSFS